MTEIDVKELKAALDNILDHLLITCKVPKVALESTFFWDIQRTALYDMSNEPKEFTVGSVADDWELAQNLVTNNAPPIASQLTQLASVLRYMGQVLGDRLGPMGG